MTTTAAQLATQAEELDEQELAQLLSSLLETYEERFAMAPDVAQAWSDEAARRAEEMRSGEDPGVPAEEVLARLRARLR